MMNNSNDGRALITLIGELAAAHDSGHIAHDTFWISLECVRLARQNSEDDDLKGATDAMSAILAMMEVYPGSDMALEYLVMAVWEKAQNETTSFSPETIAASVAATTQTDTTGTVAARSADAQTDLPSAAPQLNAAAATDERQQRPKANASPSVLTSTPQQTEIHTPSTATSSAAPKPLARGEITASASACSAPSSHPIDEASPPRSNAAETTPLAPATLVAAEKALGQSATQTAPAAPSAKHSAFDTAITLADREKLSVYDGKVDFYKAGVHRIQRAYANYKQLTTKAMKAMAIILGVELDETDLSLLRDFRERLSSGECDQLGDLEVPLSLSRTLRYAIYWRELVCEWYDNLQVAVEADEICHDDSLEKLRDGTSSHKHFLNELQATKAVMKAYTARLAAKMQE